ncbi:MAG: FAD binding domain-containing protein, partial [Planctomycetales bacterium]|nr:FAD binding domain-containing protein [Planctomycetales bacterium]
AHVQIKTRGTLGGNLCNAHPASEMPAVMLALGARLRCRSKKAGDRIIPIEEFFVGSMDNALNNDEILCEIQIQAPSANTGWAFQELARRHGDFAQCGAAVLIGVEDGKINYARIGLCSVAATPIRFNALEEWLIGMEIGENLVEEVSRFSAENLTVEDDPNMSTGNKVTLASTLIARTVARATDRVSQVNLKKG